MIDSYLKHSTKGCNVLTKICDRGTGGTCEAWFLVFSWFVFVMVNMNGGEHV